MPGRPGRSKGCLTCRKRHLKCDQHRPHCKRCLLSGLACGGFQDLTFITVNPGHTFQARDTLLKSGFTSETIEILPRTVSRVSRNSTTPLRELQLRNAYSVTAHNVQVIDRGLGLHAFQDNVFGSYTLTKLIQGGPLARALNSCETDIAGPSFLALSAMFFGAQHRHKPTIRQGYQRYGGVLLHLNSALNNDLERRSTAVLTSTIMMALFECFVPNGMPAWIQHTRGIERLFELRGSQSACNHLEFALLTQFRPAILLAALMSQRTSILAKSCWRTTEPSEYESQEDFSNSSCEWLLSETLADATELYRVDKSMTGASTDSWQKLSTAFELIARVSKCRQKLKEHDNNKPMCYAVIILLLEVVEKLWATMDPSSIGSQEDARKKAHTFAVQVCVDVKASLLQLPETANGFKFILPVHVARRTLRRESAYDEYATDDLLKASCGGIDFAMWSNVG